MRGWLAHEGCSAGQAEPLSLQVTAGGCNVPEPPHLSLLTLTGRLLAWSATSASCARKQLLLLPPVLSPAACLTTRPAWRRSHDPPVVTIGCCRTRARPGEGLKDSEANILATGCAA